MKSIKVTTGIFGETSNDSLKARTILRLYIEMSFRLYIVSSTILSLLFSIPSDDWRQEKQV